MDSIGALLNAIRPEFEFGEEQDFLAEGMLDSFDVLVLVAELEKAYGIAIEGTDILPQNLRSLAAIRGLLTKYGVTEWI